MTLLGQMLREDGIAEGLQKGELLKIITQTMKKYQKGQSPDVIAEELVEDFSLIEKIVKLIQENPQADGSAIYSLLNSIHK